MNDEQKNLATETAKPDFRFRGGHSVLDLTATLRGRAKSVPQELLDGEGSLARWLVEARLVEAPPPTTSEDVEQARQLREAVYAVADARLAGTGASTPALQTLNRIAAGRAAVPQLSEDGGMALIGPAASLIVTLARQAVELFGSAAAEHIRQCQSDSCTILFLDMSRSGKRRWCAMSGCGNKAKVASFRRRKAMSGSG